MFFWECERKKKRKWKTNKKFFLCACLKTINEVPTKLSLLQKLQWRIFTYMFLNLLACLRCSVSVDVNQKCDWEKAVSGKQGLLYSSTLPPSDQTEKQHLEPTTSTSNPDTYLSIFDRPVQHLKKFCYSFQTFKASNFVFLLVNYKWYYSFFILRLSKQTWRKNMFFQTDLIRLSYCKHTLLSFKGPKTKMVGDFWHNTFSEYKIYKKM